MSTARSIMSSTLAQFTGKIMLGFLSVIIIKLLTGYLTIEQFGNYNFIYDFLGIFGVIADLGLYNVAIREMSKDESKIPMLLGNILTIRLFMGVLAMTVAIVTGIAIFVLGKAARDIAVPIGIAIASITVLMTLLNGTLTSVLQVRYKMREATTGVIIGKIISTGYIAYIVLVLFAKDPRTGFYHAVIAGIIGNIAMLATTFYYTRKFTEIKLRFDFELMHAVFVRSLPYGIALTLNMIYFRLNGILLYTIRGEKESAIYSVGMRLIENITIISLYFMNSVLPLLTKTVEAHDKKYNAIIQNAFDVLCMISLAIAAGGYVVAYPLVAAISDPAYLSRLSEGFYGSDVGLQILLFAMMFTFVNTLFSYVLIAANQQKRLLWISLGAIVINLALNAIAIPRFGFRGAAATSVIAECYILCATMITSRRYLAYTLRFGNLIKSTIAALTMAVIVWFLRDPTFALLQNKNLIIIIPLGGVIYAGMLFATKALTKEKIKLMLGRDKPATEVLNL